MSSRNGIQWIGASSIQRDQGADAGSQPGDVVDADKWSIRVVMSTDAPVGGLSDEDGDVIPQNEWRLDRWLSSGGPILDGHYMGPGACGGPAADVVGNGGDVEQDRAEVGGRTLHRTLATVRWSRVLPRGAELAAQYYAGERSDFSVGFLVGSRVKRTALAEGDPYRVDPVWARDSGRPGGSLLRGPRLIELSAVTVGADQYATAVRSLGGLPADAGMLRWAEMRSAFVRAALDGSADEVAAALRELVADERGWSILDRIHAEARASRDPWIRALADLASR
ncbi:MAG: hypothetical protein ACO3GM_00780 [Candidatus Limnocylindrus sp.]